MPRIPVPDGVPVVVNLARCSGFGGTNLPGDHVTNPASIVGTNGSDCAMVGGAPISREFADRIGAQGYAPDAVKAVREAERLMEQLGVGNGDASEDAA
jgi:hypothetical protein